MVDQDSPDVKICHLCPNEQRDVGIGRSTGELFTLEGDRGGTSSRLVERSTLVGTRVDQLVEPSFH